MFTNANLHDRVHYRCREMPMLSSARESRPRPRRCARRGDHRGALKISMIA